MKWNLLLIMVFGTALLATSGCAVPQPRGEGIYTRVQEPSTRASYHLYLPVDYVKNNGRHPNPRIKSWPLVMTFHGMKPYDNAKSQEREWEKEADVYGYIVCAPELKTSNSFMEYPLTKEHDYVLKDKQNVIAVMEHVFATTNADRRRVLSTSWSCGGYLAHYFQNRFPDRFSCLATRLSNFSASLMIDDTIPLYKDRVAVAIFIGDGDFPACKSESEEAVAWYEARGFRTVRGKMIDNIGHARIPQTAAAFFAEQLGIEPLRPLEAARTVAEVQMTEYYPPQDMISRFAPKSRITPAIATPANAPVAKPQMVSSYVSSGAGKNYPDRPPSYEQVATRQEPGASNSGSGSRLPAEQHSPRTDSKGIPAPKAATSRNPASPAPWKPHEPADPAALAGRYADQQGKNRARSTAPDRQNQASSPKSYGVTPTVGGLPNASRTADNSPASASRSFSQPSKVNRVNIKFNGPAVGTSPHFLEYSVDLPREKAGGADFLWMDNGVWMGNESSGKKILQSPGLHQISVLIVTKDDTEYRGSATVQVLEPGPGGGAY